MPWEEFYPIDTPLNLYKSVCKFHDNKNLHTKADIKMLEIRFKEAAKKLGVTIDG